MASLRSRTVRRGPGGSRGSGVESTLYEVRARLVETKLEEDDDIHLVIKGLTTQGTMIVEFPLSPSCAQAATVGAKTRMKNARKAFVAACGMPGSSSFTQLTGRATIRGIGFFDFLHGQTVVASNGIELHPVLRFMDATCQVGQLIADAAAQRKTKKRTTRISMRRSAPSQVRDSHRQVPRDLVPDTFGQ